jgi:hypothetical protein
VPEDIDSLTKPALATGMIVRALNAGAGRWRSPSTPARAWPGLMEHQVRCWTLLAMIAHALLAVTAAHERSQHPAPDGLIALTCSEIRRLFTSYVIELSRTLACPETWSLWRRRHQYLARTSHYQRQEAAQPWT